MARSAKGPVSTRYGNGTLERLDERAARERSTRSALIQRYVAEGLAMDEYPGIVFRPGPAGRRPGLAGGPDVWEVVAVQRSFGDVRRTAEWLDLSTAAVGSALSYYAAHRAEIDDWIARNDEAAEAGERVREARRAAG